MSAKARNDWSVVAGSTLGLMLVVPQRATHVFRVGLKDQRNPRLTVRFKDSPRPQ
jgi:hypothetical protein